MSLVRRSVRTDDDCYGNKYGCVLYEGTIIAIYFGKIHDYLYTTKLGRTWYDTNESQGHASIAGNSDVTFTFALEDHLVVNDMLAWLKVDV